MPLSSRIVVPALVSGLLVAHAVHAGPIFGPNSDLIPRQNAGQEQADPGLNMVFTSPPSTVFSGWPVGNTNPARFIHGLGEAIDWVADDYLEPAVFSPLCEFSVELIVNSTGCTVMDVGWYNAKSPSTLYTLIPGVLPPEFPALNQPTTARDFRTNPNYAGGLIGFGLRRRPDLGDCGEDLRSERQWNAKQAIGALVYQSKNEPHAYYLAFDDSPNWAYSDLDYNDYLLKVSGITCEGGNVPCNTGRPGVCGPGLTECQAGTALSCKQLNAATSEKCDALDNDCNGLVDDGDLCGDGRVCFQGNCVDRCGTGEFRCSPGLTCDSDSGLCVEMTCLGVTCESGKACRGGDCVGACDGVVCPRGQSCRVGACVDPCRGVSCEDGRVCDSGVCVERCDCRGCPDGKACSASGACVDAGCETVQCAAPEICLAGKCVDPCASAVCPGNGSCVAGECQPQAPGGGGEGGEGIVIPSGGSAMANAGGSGSSSEAGQREAGGASGGSVAPSRSHTGASGCGCETGVRRGRADGRSVVFALVLAGVLRRRQRAKAGSRGAWS